MKGRIHLIAPYAELADLATGLNHELRWNMDIQLGNLEDAIISAKAAQTSGAQAVISRGGTASIIKRHIDIPVIEIKVTGFDLLQALHPYRNNGGFIGIVGYRNVIEGCKTICSILNIPIKEFIIPDEGHTNWNLVREKVSEMVQLYKLRTIVGDTVVASKFKDVINNFKLIVSGRESIIQAVEEAQSVINILEKEKEKSERFEAVINFVHDAVVATDESGIITVANTNAEKIFRSTHSEMVGKNFTKYIKAPIVDHALESGIPELDHIVSTPSGQVITNRIPIIVDNKIKGTVVTLQKVSNIQNTEQKIRQALYSKGLVTRYSFEDIITKDEQMKRLIAIAKNYAKTNATVLILGESGTGKELLAQSIHSSSLRAEGPFVAINCAALPPQLLESELFGYAEGAFTGAVKGGKIGLFELAHNGTIFLDEIGELEKHLQARLLRVLQEKQVMRLGSDKIVPVDIRIVAATNANLKQLVMEGKFREDLFYRINVLNLKSIPLRERKIDIEFLCYFFMQQFNQSYGKQIKGFQQEVIDLFNNYCWPGNVREMKNIIERIIIPASQEYITLNDIDLLIEEIQPQKNITEIKEMQSFEIDNNRFGDILEGSMEEIKVKIIRKVLENENFNKSRAAKRLKIDRSTINRLL